MPAPPPPGLDTDRCIICGGITQAREQQTLDAEKPSALKLKKAEERILVGKKKKKKEKVNKI